MSLHSWLQNLRSALAPGRGQRPSQRRSSLRARTQRPHLEVLEDRLTLSLSYGGSFHVPFYPRAVATADFNNDGHLDLTTGRDVLFGHGNGFFDAPSQVDTGSGPFADFNNDGHLDTAMFNGPSQVAIKLGNGDGTFGPPLNTPILPGAKALAAADFNSDGNMDLVYSANDDQLAPGSVEVLLGDGRGGVVARHQYEINTANPGGLAVADLNADGRPDVVTANNNKGTVSVLLGNGDGTLRYNFSSSNFAAGGYVQRVAVGDCTSDGIPDLVTTRNTTSGYGTAVVLPGRGDGTFAAPIESQGALFEAAWSAADLNGDDQLDIITASWTYDNGAWVNVYLSRGDGTFNTPQIFEQVGIPLIETTAMATGDFNEDGRPDVVVAGYDWTDDAWINNGALVVLINDYDWEPPPPPPPTLPNLRIDDVTVTEGNAGAVSATFTVTSSAASSEAITFDYATGDGTATAGSDYQAASGTLTFAPGETSKTVTVLVNGDRLGEPNETFVVNLSSPTNATIGDGQGVGTIVDDEPRITISDVTKAEGKKGKTTLFTFTVTLSAAYDQPVSMSFRTVNGTATTSDNDYVARTGTLTFAPGETTKTITIEVKGDSKREANETFYLDLFGLSSNAQFTKNRGLGTILNDD